ncbi:acyltransferase family protein [Leptolyngbya iicbica]|uniref:Acyltransferase n=2 Tax=Cyanophyceae TaxID=3028117 RepID=A0A4Q7E261_9CYAN|nr:acyltransferase family protein [Leptolyngbya sp. LK]RZM75429.1 acyltransferase [Leptolyngbya sp. LK]
MQYRAEIDGLRAIAVVAVILFHAGVKTFQGGFVGVDIFFVISGYLIALTILTDLQRQRFSLLGFYERRARRILPALFLVILVCVSLAWFWLQPADMQSFSHSLIATPYFVSNILYWSEAGYWDTASELKPLLHTWTLAIEGQFYLTFPLLLLLMWRWCRRWLLPLTILVGILSFMIAQWGAYTFPTANFYLLPSRLWELALGAAIGIALLNHKPSSYPLFSYQKTNAALVRELSGILGFILIIASLLTLNGNLPFPSAFALFPTVGTGLILAFSSSQTLAGRFLSHPLLVNIGLLSYGAYLWHHPLFVFARHRSLTQPAPIIIWILAIASFGFAYLTWQYVEKPFRNHREVNRKAFFLFWLIGSLVFVEIGILGHLTAGFSDRAAARTFHQDTITPIISTPIARQVRQNSVARLLHDNAILQIPLDSADSAFQAQQANAQVFGLGSVCDGAAITAPECRTDDNPEILLWGDSFAMQLAPGILASNPEVKLIQMTKSVCGPFFDVAPIAEPNYPKRWAEGCLAFNQQVREWLQQEQNSVKYAVLSSPFSQYLLSENKVLLRNGEVKTASPTLALQQFQTTLRELQRLGIEPIVVSPPPTNDLDLGRCITRAEWLGLSQKNCNFLEAEMSDKRVQAYQFLDELAGQFRILRLESLLCQNGICQAYAGDVPLYRDARHLSAEGAALLGQKHDFYQVILSP